MTDTGELVGGVIGLGVGLIALDMLGHEARRFEDRDEVPRKRKAQPKQRRKDDDDFFPDIF
jgi:gas vesicle protein